jgi:hypothetical protein
MRTTDPSEPAIYQIQIGGHLGPQWANWFDGMEITLQDNGDTLLTGLVTDQAALYRLLKKVRNLGMPLHSVNRIGSSNENIKEVYETRNRS